MIREIRCIYFRHTLNKDGTISGESMFRLRSDAETAAEAYNDALDWCGKSGDNLKIGGSGQNCFDLHRELILESAEIRTLENEFVFEIKLTGVPHSPDWSLLPGSEKTESGGIITRKMEYSCCNAETPDVPHEGEIIVDEDDNRLICTSSRIVDEGNNNKKLFVIFKSISHPEISEDTEENPEEDTKQEIPSRTEFFYKDEKLFCKGYFYWTKDIYGTKCAALKFWDTANAANWAGSDFVLTKMDSNADGNFGYYVELTAEKIENRLLRIETSEEDGTKTATAFYYAKKTDADTYENLLGTTPNFISGDYIVTKVTRKNANPVMYEFAVTASIKSGQVQIGETTFCEKTETGINYKKATFFVASDEVASFRSKLAVHSKAAWAGEHFYVANFKEKEDVSGSIFDINAVEIYTRMLSINKSERFSGFHNDGTPFREIIYKSVWQVHANDISRFNNQSGINASWSNDDAIVTEIIPEKKSDIEYEVKIEAQRRSNPKLHTYYNCENYSNLSNREDLDCKLIDFRLSPKDCGYYMHGDGLFDCIPGWQPTSECPLTTTDPLPRRFINSVVKIIRISETTYKKGGMHRVMDDLIKWCDIRVFNGKVANYNGSFLKSDLFAKEIYDNHGVQWTRITKVYDLAPFDTTWNIYYFRQFDL